MLLDKFSNSIFSKRSIFTRKLFPLHFSLSFALLRNVILIIFYLFRIAYQELDEYSITFYLINLQAWFSRTKRFYFIFFPLFFEITSWRARPVFTPDLISHLTLLRNTRYLSAIFAELGGHVMGNEIVNKNMYEEPKHVRRTCPKKIEILLSLLGDDAMRNFGNFHYTVER